MTNVRVGRAQVCITPPVGVSLAGYFHDRISESIRDDLFARALVIEANTCDRIALVSCDLESITAEVTDAAKTIVARECGIAPEYVLVAATHTHTGPEPRLDGVVPVDSSWLGELPARIAQAVRVAVDDLRPATLRSGRTTVEGYAYNRLFRLKDGTEVAGKGGRESEIISVAGPTDPELQTLSAVDENGQLLALVVNFALHVDVIGGGEATTMSADWPGEMARNIAAVYGADVVTLLLQGAAGDINHVPHEATQLPVRGPDKAVQLGRALAGAAMLATERAEPMQRVELAAICESVSIPYYTRDAKLWAEVAELKRKDAPTDADRYLIDRCESWPHDNKSADVPVHAMRVGDLSIVGFPSEIFAETGLEIKQWSPTEQTFVVELANARVSNYIPTGDQAERGGYGAKPILSRWLCADAGRRLADTAQVLLHRLFPGR